MQSALEEQPQQHDQRQRHRRDDDGLAGQRQAAQRQLEVPERRIAKTFGAEEQQAQTGHRKVHADRHDQQHQRAGRLQRLKRHAVQQRAERRNHGNAQQRLHRQRVLLRRGPDRQRRDQRWRQQRAATGLQRRCQAAPVLPDADKVHGRRQHRQNQQQPDRARHLAGLQYGQGQRTIGDELALWDEDDAGDREHQHGGQAQQRVDGAVGQSVQHQDAGNG